MESRAAVATLQECFDPDLFEDCWIHFARENGAFIRRTVQALCIAILAFVADELPSKILKVQLHMLAVTALQSQINALV